MIRHFISFVLRNMGQQHMQTQSAKPGIVRMTMPNRSKCEWIMEPIVEVPWLPSLEQLAKEVEALDSHSDEQLITIPGTPTLQGLVIRGTCPTNASRSAYVVFWPQSSARPDSSITRPEQSTEYDQIGRLLLMLMLGGSSGVAAAQSLVQTNAAQKAGKILSRIDDPELRAAALEYASKIESDFDALLLKECVRTNRE